MRILLLLLALVACGFAQDRDRVILKSGRILAGSLGEGTRRVVHIQDWELGALDVPHARIRAILATGQAKSLYDLVAPPDAGKVPGTFVSLRKKTEDRPAALRTGVARYRHAASDTTLFLVGAVHIGDKAYFHRLQEILDHTDVVLFEGVGAKEMGEKEKKRLSDLAQIQLKLKDLLGLGFQRDHVDYTQTTFWKNADVDFATLSKEMKEKGVSLPTDNVFVRLVMKLVFGLMSPESIKKNPKLQERLKRQTAGMLARADSMMKRMGKLKNVLIEYRNGKAMEVLDREMKAGPAGRWLSLFYGAAHLPDFCMRLQKGGWTYEGSAWVDAWVLK